MSFLLWAISCMTSHIFFKRIPSFCLSHKVKLFISRSGMSKKHLWGTLPSWEASSLHFSVACNCFSPSTCWSTAVTIRHGSLGEVELFCKNRGGPVKLISWIIVVCLSSRAEVLLAVQRIDLAYFSLHDSVLQKSQWSDVNQHWRLGYECELDLPAANMAQLHGFYFK